MKTKELLIPALTSAGILLSGVTWLIFYETTVRQSGVEFDLLAVSKLLLSEIGGAVIFGGVAVGIYVGRATSRHPWSDALSVFVVTALLAGLTTGWLMSFTAQSYYEQHVFCPDHPKICAASK